MLSNLEPVCVNISRLTNSPDEKSPCDSYLDQSNVSKASSRLKVVNGRKNARNDQQSETTSNSPNK